MVTRVDSEMKNHLKNVEKVMIAYEHIMRSNRNEIDNLSQMIKKVEFMRKDLDMISKGISIM
eukprot:CAMPEP_0116899788 /NCGR_PEP_ID=MMETSP0467-20121206/8286_1 /TAXON_ID=283647 /ORGANISM="Mesodinium pulex, Strain SPMC105" /LENGTH=61 /DNA_ID=CAMNT_0004572817 /DNA_START=105 /DNA_END=290 /DNA_ORIENTATION=-